ncbi:hypothetical protein HDV05_003830 [Chytridiales sp. JEL 0842]|nr:hypothetical protein HDV05_003830 [Chytridiales sp. JEL 0842]
MEFLSDLQNMMNGKTSHTNGSQVFETTESTLPPTTNGPLNTTPPSTLVNPSTSNAMSSITKIFNNARKPSFASFLNFPTSLSMGTSSSSASSSSSSVQNSSSFQQQQQHEKDYIPYNPPPELVAAAPASSSASARSTSQSSILPNRKASSSSALSALSSTAPLPSTTISTTPRGSISSEEDSSTNPAQNGSSRSRSNSTSSITVSNSRTAAIANFKKQSSRDFIKNALSALDGVGEVEVVPPMPTLSLERRASGAGGAGIGTSLSMGRKEGVRPNKPLPPIPTLTEQKEVKQEENITQDQDPSTEAPATTTTTATATNFDTTSETTLLSTSNTDAKTPSSPSMRPDSFLSESLTEIDKLVSDLAQFQAEQQMIQGHLATEAKQHFQRVKWMMRAQQQPTAFGFTQQQSQNSPMPLRVNTQPGSLSNQELRSPTLGSTCNASSGGPRTTPSSSSSFTPVYGRTNGSSAPSSVGPLIQSTQGLRQVSISHPVSNVGPSLIPMPSYPPPPIIPGSGRRPSGGSAGVLGNSSATPRSLGLSGRSRTLSNTSVGSFSGVQHQIPTQHHHLPYPSPTHIHYIQSQPHPIFDPNVAIYTLNTPRTSSQNASPETIHVRSASYHTTPTPKAMYATFGTVSPAQIYTSSTSSSSQTGGSRDGSLQRPPRPSLDRSSKPMSPSISSPPQLISTPNVSQAPFNSTPRSRSNTFENHVVSEGGRRKGSLTMSEYIALKQRQMQELGVLRAGDQGNSLGEREAGNLGVEGGDGLFPERKTSLAMLRARTEEEGVGGVARGC